MLTAMKWPFSVASVRGSLNMAGLLYAMLIIVSHLYVCLVVRIFRNLLVCNKEPY